MAIDEHIAQLKKLKSFHNGSYGASINFVIDIMRKYQKMVQVLSDWKTMGYNEDDGLYSLLSRVVEDENDK